MGGWRVGERKGGRGRRRSEFKINTPQVFACPSTPPPLPPLPPSFSSSARIRLSPSSTLSLLLLYVCVRWWRFPFLLNFSVESRHYLLRMPSLSELDFSKLCLVCGFCCGARLRAKTRHLHLSFSFFHHLSEYVTLKHLIT